MVVDRIVVRPDIGQRLAESFETALKLAEGLAVIEYADAPPAAASEKKSDKKTAKIHDKTGAERILFSEKFACPVSGFTIPEIEPRLFSFNNPYGACPACGGLGVEQHIDEELVIPDKDLTLRKGAIAPWAKSSSPYYIQTLTALGKFYKFTLDTKWKDLPKKVQQALLHGSGDDEIKFSYEDGVRSYDTKKPFEGVITNIDRRYRETESEWAREELGKYFSDVPCDGCNGHRLKPEALCVKIGGKHIGDISELSVRRAGEWFETVPKALNAQQNEIAARVLKEIRERLSFLLDVGLNYLTLARASGTLSGGESQRIRLASQIGSGLTGVLYVLDEPSIGLHQRDNARLLETLKRLRDLGNTVIVVEHDEDAIRARRLRRRRRPRRRRPWRPYRRAGHARRGHAQSEVADRQISHRRTVGRGAGAAAAEPSPHHQGDQRARQQPEERLGGNSARSVHLRHRRLRRRQVDAADRHALQGDRAQAQQRQRGRRARTTASRVSSISTRSSTSTSRRSAARRAPIRRPTPAPSRRSANGSPACRKPRRAATSPAASPSTSRAAAARPARATASSRSRCTSCPTSTSPATPARASATTARRSKCCSRASRSPTCST